MGHQPIEWLEQFRDETTSSKERVRQDESDKESNESKTEVNDDVIPTELAQTTESAVASESPAKPRISWADVVRRSTYDRQSPVSASREDCHGKLANLK